MREKEKKLQKMKDKYVNHVDLKKKGKLKKNICFKSSDDYG